MALAGELAKYMGNELVKSSGKGVAKAGAKAGAKSALSSLVPRVSANTGADMASKGVLNSLVPSIRTNWNGAGDIEGMLNGKFLGANDYYFPSTFSEGALGRATYGPDQPIDQKKVAGLVRAIKNNEDIAPIAGFKNDDGLIDIYDGHHRLAAYQKAGKMPRVKLFTRETKDQAYTYADEWAKNAAKDVQQYLPAKPEAGLDEYGMGTIDLRDLNTPKVQQSKNGEPLTDIANRIKAMNKSGEMSSNIKRIGSSGVAKIDKDTLPAGYDIVKKYLGKSPADITKEIEDIIGVALDDPSAGDKLAKFVEDEGYDVSKNIIDNLNTARQILDERTLDELNMEGAQKYAQFIQTRGALAKDNPSRGVGPRTFTISADDDVLSQTDAAKLDKEYSDRLGIGRSHTPMNDKTLSSDAKGYYMGGGIGINPLHARGETGVSTIAHERMHAWQDINSGSWDSRVGEAIDELRNELKKFYHTKDQIKAYRKSGYDLDYYANDKEQEARMLQSYLDNEGFTDTYHKNDSRGVEWGDEIKPAFDKFFKKLRALSKKGIALPAIAGLVGIGAMSGGKDEKTLTI